MPARRRGEELGAGLDQSGYAVLFVPLVESCMDLTPVPQDQRGSLSTGVRWSIRPRLDSDGRYGRIQAIDLATRKTLWTERQRAPQTTGMLRNGGRHRVRGRARPVLHGLRRRDRQNAVASEAERCAELGAPISYGVNGKQYVAMTWGTARRRRTRSRC